jgi:uncharacterized protein YceH (UPF0502 family)
MRLGAEQGRVIGSLIEKQLTTPQQYPLSLNALVLACNQLSNRDPVVAYDERGVDETLVSLKDAGLVRFVHPSHGRSVTRYRQVLDERLGLDNQQLALVAVLLLRGAQTVGELRTRTERMADFDGIRAVDTQLERMSTGPEPLVARLARRPGQKDERWIQLLMDVVTDDASAAAGGSSLPTAAGPAGVAGSSTPAALDRPAPAVPSGARRPDGPAPPGLDAPPSEAARTPSLAGEVAALRAEVAGLRTEIADVRATVEDLLAQLGG